MTIWTGIGLTLEQRIGSFVVLPVPDALVDADWAMAAVALGPETAEARIHFPEIVASAVQWRADPGDPWSATQNVGGGNWRLLEDGEIVVFPDGTYSGFEARYRTEGSAWSIESDDAKGFTFDEAVITPDEATISLALTAGFATSLDVVATAVFVASPEWPMEFRLTAGANVAHLWSGNVITFYPAHDAEAGTVETTCSAYWSGGAPALAPLPAPVNTALPVITGTLAAGATLTAGSDTWTDTPSQRDYEWLVDGEVDPAAVGPTFTAVEGEIAVRVYAWVNDGYAWSRSLAAQSATVVVGIAAPVALGAGTWAVTQGGGEQTYDASLLFEGVDMAFTIFEIVGATGSTTFGVFDGVDGYEQFVVPDGPLEVSESALDINLNALTGEITADGDVLSLMSGITITIRATNSGGFADEDIAFSVVAAGAVGSPLGLLLTLTQAATPTTGQPVGLLLTLTKAA